MIRDITDFFINVEALGVQEYTAFILSLELEKITQASIEVLEIPIIKKNTSLVKEKGGVFFRSKFRQVHCFHKTNTGKIAIIDIRVDSPAFFQVPNHLFHHVKGLARAFFAKNENKPVRIIISPRLNREPNKKDTTKNQKNSHSQKKRGAQKRPPGRRLDMNEAVDNADARTDKGNKDKAENQLIVSDSTDKFADPCNGTSDPRANIRKHGRNRISGGSSRLKNHPF